MSGTQSLELFIIKKNNWGEPQLIEQPELKTNVTEKVNLFDLKSDGYWAIKNPSDNIKKLLDAKFPGWKMYKCSGGVFAISPKATTYFKDENSGHGSGTIIEFIDLKGEHWFLLVADNKPYISSSQGCAELNESYEHCAKREVMEETKINLSDVNLSEIASYDFMMRNELVDCAWKVVTKVFFAQLSWKFVSHLFVNGLISDQINIIDVKKLPFALDEIDYLIAIPVKMIGSAPELFPEIQIKKLVKGEQKQVPVEFPKAGHHRQFLELFKTGTPISKPPYIDAITFDKRYDQALKLFKELNPNLFINC